MAYIKGESDLTFTKIFGVFLIILGLYVFEMKKERVQMILSYGFLSIALILTSVGQLLFRYYYIKNNKVHLFLAIISLFLVPFVITMLSNF